MMIWVIAAIILISGLIAIPMIIFMVRNDRYWDSQPYWKVEICPNGWYLQKKIELPAGLAVMRYYTPVSFYFTKEEAITEKARLEGEITWKITTQK